MQPPGLKRIIYPFKGIRIKCRRKLIGKREKEIYHRGRKDRIVDRAMKRGEKHLYRLFISQFEE